MPGRLGHAFPGLSARKSPSILLPDVGSFKPLHALMTAAMVIYYCLTTRPESQQLCVRVRAVPGCSGARSLPDSLQPQARVAPASARKWEW